MRPMSAKRTETNALSLKAYINLTLGAALLLTFIIFALTPESIAPYGAKEMFEPWQGLSPEHILGTNDMGYDIFTEIVYATAQTLYTGLLSALIALVVGILFGLIAGYAGGIVGAFFDGVINVFMMLPKLPVVIVLAAFIGQGNSQIVFIIAAMSWVGTARAVRAKAQRLKSAPFIEALRGIGCSKPRIIFRHLLPNLRDIAAAKYVSSVASAVMMESTVSFLGLGDPTHPTWGTMISFAYKRGGFMMEAYNWLLAPGICIMLLVLAFYMINYFAEQRSKSVKSASFKE